MSIIDPLVEFWLDGGFDVMRHPISYYRLSHAVKRTGKAIKKSIENGSPLEDVATILAANLPRIRELGKAYQGGEPLPTLEYLPLAVAVVNTPEEQRMQQLAKRSAEQLFEQNMHGPTRRGNTVGSLLLDLWRPVYDYGKVGGVSYEQVAQLVHQKTNGQ